MVHPDDFCVGQFQTVFEHTREEIQLGFSRGYRGCQSVDSVPNIQHQQHDRGRGVELPTLCVGLVDLLHGATQQIGIKAQAVSKHLNVRNFDVELALVGIGKIHRPLTGLVAHQRGQPSPAT